MEKNSDATNSLKINELVKLKQQICLIKKEFYQPKIQSPKSESNVFGNSAGGDSSPKSRVYKTTVIEKTVIQSLFTPAVIFPQPTTTIIHNHANEKKNDEKSKQVAKKEEGVSDATKFFVASGVALVIAGVTYGMKNDEGVLYYYDENINLDDFVKFVDNHFPKDTSTNVASDVPSLMAYKLSIDVKLWQNLFHTRVGTKTASKIAIPLSGTLGIGAFLLGSSTFGVGAILGCGALGAYAIWKETFNTKNKEENLLVNIVNQIDQLIGVLSVAPQDSQIPKQPTYPSTVPWDPSQ
jgi:hypothetical protein